MATLTTRKAFALAVLCTAQFMVILDTTIVNVALPSIREDLGFASQTGLQYVISLYALAFGGSLILAGRAADLFGRRRTFAVGLVVFAVASAVCALAPAPIVLLVARVLQGLGSALVSSAALSLLTTMFAEGRERNRALGAWGAVGGAAGASGLLLGGALTGLFGWPSIFLVNLPVAAVALVAAGRVLPGQRGERNMRLDLPGAVLITLGLGSLVFGLTRAETDGPFAPSTAVLLVLGIVLLASFVNVERRVQHPLVSFGLFRLPGLAGGNLIALLLTTVIASNLFFTTLFVQQVLDFTPVQTGLAFLPNSILVVAGSAVASRLSTRVGTGRMLAVGLALVALGSLLLSLLSQRSGYAGGVLPGFALTGLGLGVSFVSVTIAATRGVQESDSGLAAGVLNTAQQLGFAVGIAAVVTLATAIGDAGPDRPLASYVVGYRIDAALAGVGVAGAILLARDAGGPGRSSCLPGPGARVHGSAGSRQGELA